MFCKWQSKGFLGGLLVGLLIGLGMLLGAIAAMNAQSNRQLSSTDRLLNAVATNSGETMAIATGPIADGVEGIFILDFLTGRLQCLVVNPRTATLGGAFEHNVIGDLGVAKKSKYLMVTGEGAWRTTGGNIKPADCVLYVANDTLGTWAAYTLPWNRNAANFNAPQAAGLTVIGSGRIRDLAALQE